MSGVLLIDTQPTLVRRSTFNSTVLFLSLISGLTLAHCWPFILFADSSSLPIFVAATFSLICQIQFVADLSHCDHPSHSPAPVHHQHLSLRPFLSFANPSLSPTFGCRFLFIATFPLIHQFQFVADLPHCDLSSHFPTPVRCQPLLLWPLISFADSSSSPTFVAMTFANSSPLPIFIIATFLIRQLQFVADLCHCSLSFHQYLHQGLPTFSLIDTTNHGFPRHVPYLVAPFPSTLVNQQPQLPYLIALFFPL